MIHYIPTSAPTPRTMSEADRRAEFAANLDRIRRAKVPPLHTRRAAPNLRPLLWAVGIFIVLCAVSYAVSKWGWAVIIVGIVVAMVIAWAAGTTSMAEDEKGASDERPEYPRGDA